MFDILKYRFFKVLTLIAVIAVAYGFISFVSWELNIGNWGYFARTIFGLFTLIAIINTLND